MGGALTLERNAPNGTIARVVFSAAAERTMAADAEQATAVPPVGEKQTA
jgi:hypothetical protein